MASRRLRFWLVVALLVSNLCVGVLSLYFLRSVNERYATLFEGGIPVVNRLRTLTREMTYVQRLARRIAEPENIAIWPDLLREMQAQRAKVMAHAVEVGDAKIFQNTEHAAAIIDLSREYDVRVGEYIQLARAESLPVAGKFNNEILRPTYDKYQLTLDAAAIYVEEQGANLRDRYAKDSRFFGGLLLAFASWPVIAAGLGVVVLGVLIVTLLVTIFTPAMGWGKRMPRGGR